MDPRTRRELARYGAPAAFLAAVTIAVILIRAGLSGGGSEAVTTVGELSTRSTTAQTTTKIVLTTPQATTSTSATTTPGAEYYTVQSGDTLGSIATQYDTTVDELMTLNPGIDPNAMVVGQRIRVK